MTIKNFPGQNGANFQGERIILLWIGVWQYPPMIKDKSPYSTSCFEGKRKKKKFFFHPLFKELTYSKEKTMTHSFRVKTLSFH